MTTLLFDIGEPPPAHGEALCAHESIEAGMMELRAFPDGETYVRIDSDCAGRPALLLADLHRPDPVLPKLYFVASTLRDLGASRIGLVAPYLPYLRQDKRFRAGEGVTSRYFAGWMSGFLDWLVCVDPHLHRYDTLDEVYEIPGRVVPTAPLLARWLADHVERPVLVGPDAESSQWVERVAEEADAPSMILEKERRGDRDVRVSVPDVERWRDHTPVLVDDIISTGHTMCETIGHLLDAGLEAPICIGVHAIFADEALDEIREAGAGRVITTNAIAHPTNEIDISDQIVEAVEEFTRP